MNLGGLTFLSSLSLSHKYTKQIYQCPIYRFPLEFCDHIFKGFLRKVLALMIDGLENFHFFVHSRARPPHSACFQFATTINDLKVKSELKVDGNFRIEGSPYISVQLLFVSSTTSITQMAGEDDGLMIFGYCCGGNPSDKQLDDDTYLDTHSSIFSNSYTYVSDDDSVAMSVVAAVTDLASGELFLELGADLVRSASEMVAEQGLQVLEAIELDASTDTSSFFTDHDIEDGEDTSTYVRMDDMTLVSIRSGSSTEVSMKESPALTPSEKAANAHAATVATLQTEQSEAVGKCRRQKEEEHPLGGDAPASLSKHSVAEEILEEEDDSSGGETDDDNYNYANMDTPITQATESVGYHPTPLVVHQIQLPPTPPTPPRPLQDDASSINALPPDFVPFWSDQPQPLPASPTLTPVWVLKREVAKRKKAAREQKLLKAVPSFLRKRTFGSAACAKQR